MQEKMYLTNLQENSEATISCKVDDRTAEFHCNVVKICEEFICLEIPDIEGKRLSFDGVSTSILGTAEDGLFYRFQECNIFFYKGIYVAKCTRNGVKVNRRGSFRIGISVIASMLRGGDAVNVYVRDISASGFAITTDKELAVGEEIGVRFDDLGCRLALFGKVVRKEETEQEDRKVYGLQMTRKCPALESYINMKQRSILKKKRM